MCMENYDVSVIVSTYNRLHELKLTLDTLCKQSLSKDRYEVIVCDDGSKDSTIELVKEYEKFINLKYCYQPDIGFRAAAVRNLGIKVSQGRICVFIDNGILLSPIVLELHLKSHVHEKCAVMGYIYGFDDLNANYEYIKNIVDSNNDVAIIVDELERRGILDAREVVYSELGDSINNYPAPWVLFWSANMSVSRKLLFDVGLFDESFTTWGGEDNDLALALFTKGVEFIFDRNIKCIHYPHPKTHNIIKNPVLAKKEFEEKLDYLYQKYKLDTIKFWLSVNELKLNQWLIENNVCNYSN